MLELLVDGLTNVQIGHRLYMSPKTASVHVSSILRKLGVANRLQAATLAERSGPADRRRLTRGGTGACGHQRSARAGSLRPGRHAGGRSGRPRHRTRGGNRRDPLGVLDLGLRRAHRSSPCPACSTWSAASAP